MKFIATIVAAMAVSSFAFADEPPRCIVRDAMDELSAGFNYLNESQYESAFPCFQSVAEENPIAAFNLGVMFTTGRGTETNNDEALKWFRKAAQAGVDEAQYNLGVRYFWGRGVEQNYQEAYKWFDAASRSGYQPAMTALRLTAFRLTPEDIEWARRSSMQIDPGSSADAPTLSLRLP